MSVEVVFREFQEKDASAVAALNNAAVPNVNALDKDALLDLIGMAVHSHVAVMGEDIVGLMVAFAPGTAYDSLNYRWFCDRYGSFLYVDRVVVSEAARGSGIGKRLYEALFDYASQTQATSIACEVNERPPNPGSMQFHNALGFSAVGEQETEGGAKSVVLLMKPMT